MGLLIPDNFQMESLVNDSERLVVSTLVERLTDGWFVLPDVGLLGGQDRQMDIVVAHERDGVAVLEVKGHRAKLEQGMWCAGGVPLSPQPLTQAKNNAYELHARLRDAHPTLARVKVEYGVVFPNMSDIVGKLPPDVERAQFLLAGDLEDPMEALDRLMTLGWGNAIGAVGVRKIVETLRPDAELVFDPEARARLVRVRLDSICAAQVGALESLDMNRRVLVTGGAGTGKTRLAMAWARRGSLRGESVLLSCFNDPLAADMWERFGADDHVTINSFWEVAFQLDGMPPLDIPDDADGAWWDTKALAHLEMHWHEATDRFDTIVVDEAQDFHPAWIALLERLLHPTGARRLMLLADPAQSIYARGFDIPAIGDGWARCELVSNCRNSYQIASLLHHRLGGPSAPVGGPEALSIKFVEVGGVDAAVEVVGDEIDLLMDDDDRAPDRILVATATRSVRDRLHEELGFVAWEASDERSTVCETVHRIKGLEFDHVILVITTDDVSDALLYIGISRAVSGLTLVGPTSVAERLDLRSLPEKTGR